MASFSIYPTSQSVTAGQTFSVQVILNANGTPVVDAQFQMSYPQSELQPVAFSFAPGWIQTFDVGTDVLSGGIIIQAGGYPTVLTGSKAMGTLTFTALHTGEATLALVPGNNYIFQTDGGNFFTGPLASAEVGISPGNGVVPAPQVASAGAVAQNPSIPASLAQESAAAAGNASVPGWVWLVLAAAVLFIAWRVYAGVKNKKSKKRW